MPGGLVQDRATFNFFNKLFKESIMIQHMTEVLGSDFQVSFRSREQIWAMALLFSADREAFCTWMLNGYVHRNGVTFS